MKITIAGGGGLGHVCAAVASTHDDIEISMLTGRPSQWSNSISATDPDGKVYHGRLTHISSDPTDIVPNADIVLLCLPGYLIEKELLSIKPFLGSNTAVGSIVASTGFFFQAHKILPTGTTLFGFQRVPFISRVAEYGHSALLLGYKDSLSVAIENSTDSEALRSALEHTFDTPVKLLDNFYEAALTNSNPILHTARLYTMWHNWDGTPFNHQTLFYYEWDEASAQALIDMDSEFMAVLDRLPVRPGAIPPLLEYYESSDAASLAAKIRSIPAFKPITAPMTQTDGGWIPDYTSRYFTEDFPFGLRYIKEIAVEHNVATPVIDRVLAWGLSVSGYRR